MDLWKSKAVIEMRGIHKVFSDGVVANNEIDFTVKKGEIHALIGENGAGKSTLMKILFGLVKPTSGEIIINGKKVQFNSSRDAIKHKIGMVHQNFMLIPSFTVAENIVLGDEPVKHGLVDKQEIIQITEDLSEKFGLSVKPNDVIQNINVGQRQRVEILKTLYRKAEILILDEPTAVLTPQETDDLFKAIQTLVANGKTVIFITHKLREIKEISHRVTVMRQGNMIGTMDTKDVNHEQLANMMVGREVFLNVLKPKKQRGPKRMNICNLSYTAETGCKVLREINLNLFSGEILGIAGVEGNGQTEFVEVLTGLRKPQSGEILIRDKNVSGYTPRKIRQEGLSHIPEDRLTNGVAVQRSINENLISDRYYKKPIKKGIFIDYKLVKKTGEHLIKKFSIKTPNGNVKVDYLSGGNIQKVIVAREFSSNPYILIASQPTRGIDVGATEFIREHLVEIRNKGTAILLVSADLSEVMSLSDRIITLYEGRITGVFPDTESISEKELGLYMLGIKQQTYEEMENLL